MLCVGLWWWRTRSASSLVVLSLTLPDKSILVLHCGLGANPFPLSAAFWVPVPSSIIELVCLVSISRGFVKPCRFWLPAIVRVAPSVSNIWQFWALSHVLRIFNAWNSIVGSPGRFCIMILLSAVVYNWLLWHHALHFLSALSTCDIVVNISEWYYRCQSSIIHLRRVLLVLSSWPKMESMRSKLMASFNQYVMCKVVPKPYQIRFNILLAIIGNKPSPYVVLDLFLICSNNCMKVHLNKP